MCVCHTVAQCMSVLENIWKHSCLSRKPMRQRRAVCIVLSDNRLSVHRVSLLDCVCVSLS